MVLLYFEPNDEYDWTDATMTDNKLNTHKHVKFVNTERRGSFSCSLMT